MKLQRERNGGDEWWRRGANRHAPIIARRRGAPEVQANGGHVELLLIVLAAIPVFIVGVSIDYVLNKRNERTKGRQG